MAFAGRRKPSVLKRILIHDFAGHPFTVGLSRALAQRGHAVLHLYGAGNPTPKGLLTPLADDPPSLRIAAVAMPGGYERYRFVARWRQEQAYGRRLAAEISAWRPDVVLSANAPLAAQAAALRASRRIGARFFFWLQDLTGEAAWRLLRRRWLGLGALIGGAFRWWEARICRRSDGVVAISPDFAPRVAAWGVAEGRLSVIENWAPLADLPRLDRSDSAATAWAAEHNLTGRFIFLYAGMMGLKHKHELPADLARHYRGRNDVAVVVASQGLGRERLERIRAAEGLENLHLLDFQPFDRVPAMLASAGALVATLEEEAGVYAAPSKVLSCLCAGRPLLAAIPSSNLTARLIRRVDAGFVIAGDNREAFLAAADILLNDPALATAMGERGRRYAEAAFDIGPITDRFVAVLSGYGLEGIMERAPDSWRRLVALTGPTRPAAAPKPEEDADSLRVLAQQHGMVLALARGMGKSAPNGGEHRDEVWRQVSRAVALARLLVQAVTILERAGIPVATFKGVGLALALYGNLAERDAGDLDLIVPADRLPEAVWLLRNELGAVAATAPFDRATSLEEIRRLAKYTHVVMLMHEESGLIIDLHRRWFRNPHLLPLDPERVWTAGQRVRIGQQWISLPDPVEHFIYLCCHAVKDCCYRLKWLNDIRWALSRCEWIGGVDGFTAVAARAAALGATRPVAAAVLVACTVDSLSVPPVFAGLIAADPVISILAAEGLRACQVNAGPGGLPPHAGTIRVMLGDRRRQWRMTGTLGRRVAGVLWHLSLAPSERDAAAMPALSALPLALLLFRPWLLLFRRLRPRRDSHAGEMRGK
jgi:colanic acid biosynthesis glycosyl transferase WcaI